jgi:hypothetical protein
MVAEVGFERPLLRQGAFVIMHVQLDSRCTGRRSSCGMQRLRRVITCSRATPLWHSDCKTRRKAFVHELMFQRHVTTRAQSVRATRCCQRPTAKFAQNPA